jgi:hypothetical protein
MQSIELNEVFTLLPIIECTRVVKHFGVVLLRRIIFIHTHTHTHDIIILSKVADH